MPEGNILIEERILIAAIRRFTILPLQFNLRVKF